MEGESPPSTETKPNLPSNSRELINLLQNKEFQDGFIITQTQIQREQRQQIQKEVQDKTRVLVKAELDKEAAERLGTTIEEGKKRGKEWGDAIRGVGSEVIRTEKQPDGSLKNVTFLEELKERAQKQVENDPEHQTRANTADQLILEAEANQRKVLEKLIQDAEAKANDPALLEALEVWGRSPNADGNHGIDNQGYNAGIVHFFEYRSRIDKNGRYKNSDTPITIDGFINYSKELKGLLEDINPNTNSKIETSALLKDESGQIRTHILTSTKDRIVTFRKEGEIGLPKIITIIPGQNEKSFNKAVDDEISGKSISRLNQLGKIIEVVSLDEYNKITETP